MDCFPFFGRFVLGVFLVLLFRNEGFLILEWIFFKEFLFCFFVFLLFSEVFLNSLEVGCRVVVCLPSGLSSNFGDLFIAYFEVNLVYKGFYGVLGFFACFCIVSLF